MASADWGKGADFRFDLRFFRILDAAANFGGGIDTSFDKLRSQI
jgi:hypothetical protein